MAIRDVGILIPSPFFVFRGDGKEGEGRRKTTEGKWEGGQSCQLRTVSDGEIVEQNQGRYEKQLTFPRPRDPGIYVPMFPCFHVSLAPSEVPNSKFDVFVGHWHTSRSCS